MAVQTYVVDLQHLPPADCVLSPREAAFYQTLKLPKRKHEWLGGRFALKKLLTAHLGGAWTDYTVLAPGGVGKPTVTRAPGSVPLAVPSVRDEGQSFVAGKGGPGSGIPFSITHSNGFAVAAIAPQAKYLGIDLEKIAPRIRAWKQDFFHPSELTQETDEFLTTLWTQKEALVKLLGSGLTVNSFDVRVVRGTPQFLNRAAEIYTALGRPPILLETRPLLPGFCFSVAVGK